MLRHISGISDRMARRIVVHRSTNGAFASRAGFSAIAGLEGAIWRQAAGFLRVPASDVLLDRSWIHPECYPVVEKMAASLHVGIADLIGNKELVSSLKIEEFVTESVGLPTLGFIREELLAPGRDVRGRYAPPRLRAEISAIADLKEGATLEGTVTNVTNFGAFVDIGIQQDGLVHLSQMSNRFIRDPREAVKVGDLVQVKVISVELETKRIGLSMKALLPAIPRRRRKPQSKGTPLAAPAGIRDAASAVGTVERGPVPAEGGSAIEVARPPRPRPAPGIDRRPRPRREPSARSHDPQRGDRPRRNDNRRPDERPRKSEFPQKVAPPPPPPVVEEPKGPEPTLQEKIAILQSKFRGIH
jgi:transcriptional accessory protein Tex/SPT6